MGTTTDLGPVTIPPRTSVAQTQPQAYRQAQAREHGESDARLHQLNAWEEASVFTARERAALGLAEAITRIREGHVPEPVWAAAAEQFSEAEVGALILSASMINVWNRIAITSRTTPGRRL